MIIKETGINKAKNGWIKNFKLFTSRDGIPLKYLAKKIIKATFINSEGWRLIKNKLIQRFDPEAETP